jgi:hypothetical protein
MRNHTASRIAALGFLVLPALAQTGSQPELAGSVSYEIASKSGMVQRVSITVGDGGSGPYKSALIGDPGLPTHTLYRPRDLSPFGRSQKLPIVAWGNGGCRNSSGEFRNFLTEID